MRPKSRSYHTMLCWFSNNLVEKYVKRYVHVDVCSYQLLVFKYFTVLHGHFFLVYISSFRDGSCNDSIDNERYQP